MSVKYHDLTQPLWEYAPKWVHQPEVRFGDIRQIVRDGVSSRTISTSLHAGTHVDAPSHFPGGSMVTLDQIPIEQLCGTCVVLDLYQEDNWGVITAEMLENATPKIEPGDRVILNTGWHRYHGVDDEKFMLYYPGLNKGAVDWFVEKKVAWVGSDTPTPDHAFMLRKLIGAHRPEIFATAEFDEDDFPLGYTHKNLLGNNILMIEQLGGDIDAPEVNGQRVEIMALPPKYKNAEASQIRVVAVTGRQ